jgi:S-adenosylmethionine hydrolase
MAPMNITFTSDFGWCGGYVAACEATVARIAPEVRMFHVCHDVPVGDVSAAALLLARLAPLYPPAVHLAVVDPGVGTSRRPLVLATGRGDLLVGPDNGLLLDAVLALGGATAAWELLIDEVRSRAGLPAGAASHTFHGRDLFAPASALLATGADPGSLGRSLEWGSLIRLNPVRPRPAGGGISAPVIEIDRFGNVGLGLPFADLPGRRDARTVFAVEVVGEGAPDWTARMVRTYGDLTPGELGLIQDSWEQAALALNGASAAELLGVRRGSTVRLEPDEDLASPPGEERRP